MIEIIATQMPQMQFILLWHIIDAYLEMCVMHGRYDTVNERVLTETHAHVRDRLILEGCLV